MTSQKKRAAGPYRAEFGAIHREGVPGFIFTVDRPEFAPDVASALNAELVLAPLLNAAQAVMQGLLERIDAAPKTAVPVFAGIAELHDAISLAARQEAADVG